MKTQKLSHHFTNLRTFLPTPKGKFWLHKVLLGKEGGTYGRKNGVTVCWQCHHHVAGNIIPYVKQLRQPTLVKFDEHLVLLKEVQL